MAKGDTLIYLNTLINNIDPGKDFHAGSILTNPVHGKFIKNNLIAPLFNLEALPPADQTEVGGVADKKEFLEKKIKSAISLQDFNKEEIFRLSFDANGTDQRMEGYNIAHDSGATPERLCKNCTYVLTPGSVLDPAYRLKKASGKGDGLAKGSTLNHSVLGNIGLDSALTSVEFLDPTKGQYTFRFKTTIPGFKEVEVVFDKKFDEISSNNKGGEDFSDDFKIFVGGNPAKNKFIRDHWNNGKPTSRNLGLMKLLTLAKELGDTLQVIWLKEQIKPLGLAVDETFIATGDTVVWLRALLNGVSCIHTDGYGVTHLYRIPGTEAQKLVGQVMRKDTIIRQLSSNHAGVIASLDLFLKKLNYNNTMFQGKEMHYGDKNDNSAILDIAIIVRSVLKYIKAVSADILKTVNRMAAGNLKAIDNYVEAHTMKSPFKIHKDKYEITHGSFDFFLPNVKGESKIRFRPNLITGSLGKKNKRIDIEAVLGDIPREKQEGGSLKASSLKVENSKSRSRDKLSPVSIKEHFLKCLETNIKSPGFLPYFVGLYILELLFIGYSYAKAIDYPNYEKFEALFVNDNAIFIGKHFGKMYDLTFEIYPTTDAARIKKYDELMMELLCIIAVSVSKVQAGMTIYDVAYDDIHWFCQFVQDGLKGNPKLNEIAVLFDGVENAHWGAMDVYQELFDAEFALTILNERTEKTPQQYAKEHAPSVESIRTQKEEELEVEEEAEVQRTPPKTPPKSYGRFTQSKKRSLFKQSRKLGKSITQAKRNRSTKTWRNNSKRPYGTPRIETIVENSIY